MYDKMRLLYGLDQIEMKTNMKKLLLATAIVMTCLLNAACFSNKTDDAISGFLAAYNQYIKELIDYNEDIVKNSGKIDNDEEFLTNIKEFLEDLKANHNPKKVAELRVKTLSFTHDAMIDDLKRVRGKYPKVPTRYLFAFFPDPATKAKIESFNEYAKGLSEIDEKFRSEREKMRQSQNVRLILEEEAIIIK